ncbi:MAG TPA: MFS transporter [Candidatus Acidoferrum sp.]|nr:MFS transporter [Candidatus Acidoferrum sp.]
MRDRVLLVASLVLVALNLRPALSSVAPVLPEIMRDTGLSSAGASLLTTAPVLCLGLFGPLAPVAARWMRSERVVFLFMAVLVLGLLMRGAGTVPALLSGSVLIGIGIGIVNVLLPALIKKDFPRSAALMTGVYTMALSTGAALASGLTVPLSKLLAGSWAWALAAWVLPVLAAMVAWLPRLRDTPEAGVGRRVDLRGIWTSALAWQVTLFMGLQSALAYCVFGWLAPILRDRGMSDVGAGALVSVSIVAQVAAALLTPVAATRGRDQRPAVVISMALNMAGLLGCVFGPLSLALLWAIVLGAGQGASFALALTLIVLRAPDARTAGQLSSMAQGVGYCLAAAGPLLVGLLHGWTGSWSTLGILFLVIGTGALLAGLGAGRNRHLDLT